MSKYVIARDTRLLGTFESGLQQTHPDLLMLSSSASVPLASLFSGMIGAQGGQSSVPDRTLYVLCHGFAGSSAQRQQSGDFGGMGLQLGMEGVLHSNVNRWDKIRNVFRDIVVYACGAGDTQAGSEGTTADGRYLMGALAIHTGANVFAADRIQWYRRTGFNFGNWEGQLYRFPPSGGNPVPVGTEPVPLSRVGSML